VSQAVTWRSRAVAPANIALVKYMGKSDPGTNLPANGSLSLTLDSLCTVAEAVARVPSGARAEGALTWVPELPRLAGAPGADDDRFGVPDLGEAEAARIGAHLRRLEAAAPEALRPFGISIRRGLELELRSANSFPHGAGIASSASSYAAITLACLGAMAEGGVASMAPLLAREDRFRRTLSSLSRTGSGSSCRSFFGPWAIWSGSAAARIDSSLPELRDLVVVVDGGRKAVSSGEAHRRVASSALWAGRPGRAEVRLARLVAALSSGDLAEVARLSWAEAFEMHSLFHTSEPPFTYWEPGTLAVLRWLEPQVREGASGAPPIVTLDAGPNVHVLVPAPEAAGWESRLRKAFPGTRVLCDRQGEGARWV